MSTAYLDALTPFLESRDWIVRRLSGTCVEVATNTGDYLARVTEDGRFWILSDGEEGYRLRRILQEPWKFAEAKA